MLLFICAKISKSHIISVMTEPDITVLLQKLSLGEKDRLDDVYTSLYDEIKRIALHQISHLNSGETITPTVIANECYLKLAKQSEINLSSKRHFLNYLAKTMRLMLIDIIRSKSSGKRSHAGIDDNISLVVGDKDVDIKWLEIDQLLDKIERINPQFSEILQHKLIFNLTFREIAELMGISERQVMRLWKQATTLITALSNNDGE